MREMKDSGIEWIGEIPADWNIVQARYLFKIGRGRVIAQTELQDDGIYPVFSSQTKDNGCLGYINTYDFDVSQLTWTTDGANAGTVFLRSGKHNCTNVCGTLQPLNSEIDLMFQKYALEHIAYYHKRADTNGFKIMNNEMADIHTILPPLVIQHRIADYLDRKCSQIDAIIARQQEVIEKLKAYKLSVMTEAVTKGLNPDMPMKDSGIEWIGEIPEHWEMIKTRYVVKNIGDIDHYMPESVSVGIPYLMTGDLKDFASEVDFDSCKQVTADDYLRLSKKMKIEKGDLIFARYATIGTVCLVDVDRDFLVSYSCVVVKVDPNVIESEFLMYYYKSTAFLEEIAKYSNANTQSNIGKDSMYKAKICIPPIKEQKAIIRYLDKKCSSIELLLKSKQAIIDKLTEYKKSLIYEVVTGKKEV